MLSEYNIEIMRFNVREPHLNDYQVLGYNWYR